MKEQATALDPMKAGAEWFAAWLPKPALSPMAPRLVLESSSHPTEDLALATAFDQIRFELKAVTGHLIDPSANGVRASLPHLERAVAGLSVLVQAKKLSTIEPSLASLRAEIAVASMLFENAYTLQAGWAAQSGLNFDGTAKQLLYSRPGEQHAVAVRQEIHIAKRGGCDRDSWEG